MSDYERMWGVHERSGELLAVIFGKSDRAEGVSWQDGPERMAGKKDLTILKFICII